MDSGLGIKRAFEGSVENCVVVVAVNTPRSSFAPAGMSPRRIDSKLLISAACFSKVVLGIAPTGTSKMRT